MSKWSSERSVRQALDLMGWGEPSEMPEGHPCAGISAHNGKTMVWLGENWGAALIEVRKLLAVPTT